MTLNVVVNHPVKDLIDAEMARFNEEMAKFNKAHEEGRLTSALVYYETENSDGRCFSKELTALEALGVCSMVQDYLIAEIKEE